MAHLRTLSPTELSLLTRALSRHLAHPDILEEARLVKELPKRLRTSFLESVFNQSEYPPLCQIHLPLDPHLLHTLLHNIASEIGPRLRTLVCVYGARLSPLHISLIRTLLLVHALWLPPGSYRSADPHLPNVPENDKGRWAYQADGCEGCILARVGGDSEVVRGLRAVLLGRRLGGRGRVLLRVVEGWIEGLCDEELWGWSKRVGQELRDAKKRTRDSAEGKTAAHDYATGIINHYASLASHTYLPKPSPTPTRHHFPKPSPTPTRHHFSFHRRPDEERHTHPSYSRRLSSTANLSPKPRSTTEVHAASYRELLGDGIRDSDKESQNTCWSHLYTLS